MESRLNAVRKQNGGAIVVTGYRSYAVRRVELMGYFVDYVSDTKYFLCISLSKQKPIV